MLLKRVSRSIICKKFQEDVLNFCIFNPFRLSKALLNLYFKHYSFNSINFQFHQKFKIFYKKTITLFGRNRILNAFSKLKILKKKLVFFFGFTTLKQVAFLFNHLYLKNTNFLFKQLLLFLEFRLDFLLFRLRYVFHVFFARTFLIMHGVLVNKKIVQTFLFHVRLGDLVEPILSSRRFLFLKFYRFWYNEFIYAHKNKKINLLYKIFFFRHHNYKFRSRNNFNSNFINCFRKTKKTFFNCSMTTVAHFVNKLLIKYQQLRQSLNVKLLIFTILWFTNFLDLSSFYRNKLHFLRYFFFYEFPYRNSVVSHTSRLWQFSRPSFEYWRHLSFLSHVNNLNLFFILFYSLHRSFRYIYHRTFLYMQLKLKPSLRYNNLFYASKTITLLNIKILARQIIFYDFLVRFFKQPGNWIHLHKFAKVFFIKRYLLKVFKYYRFMNFIKLKKLMSIGYRKKYFLKKLLLKSQFKTKRNFFRRFRIYKLPYFRWIKFFYSSVLNRNPFITIKLNRLNFFSTRLLRKVKYRFKKTLFFKTKIDYRAFPYLKIYSFFKLLNSQQSLMLNDFLGLLLFTSRFTLINRSRYIKPVLSKYNKVFDFSFYGKIRMVDRLQHLFRNTFFNQSKNYLILKRLDFNGYVLRKYYFKNFSLNFVFTNSMRRSLFKQFNLIKSNALSDSISIYTSQRLPIFLFFCRIKNLNLRIVRKFFARSYVKK